MGRTLILLVCVFYRIFIDRGPLSTMEIEKLYGTSSPLLFNEENVLYYRPGGYHPVVLKDTLKNGRYIICHKLGYGGSSTVWAARDSEYVYHSSILERLPFYPPNVLF